jgi:ankyrin repeat protein
MATVRFLSPEIANRCVLDQYAAPRSLHEAIYWGNYEAAEDMIKGGADVNAKDEKLRTPLHYASAVVARRREVKLLLRNGADPAAKDIDGITPVDIAEKFHQEDHLELLTNKMANLSDKILGGL